MAIGTIGKYERLDVLGHGTSGVVYLAWDSLLRRQVALKEIRADGPEMERVLEEARVLDRLRHPNIVAVHSVEREQGAVLIDMELVRGRNLADHLKSLPVGTGLPPDASARITRAVLSALGFAHARRIVHRDVKPANILLDDDGVTVKLTDFGLAEALGTGSVAGGGGTYPYMAPEDFAENADSDYRSDLWAVGIVLFEMLTGQRPFSVERKTRDPFAWQRVIEREDAPLVSSLRPELGTAWDALLRRALAKAKENRFPTAEAFAAALEACCGNDDKAVPITTAAPPDAAEPPAREDIRAFVFAGGALVVHTLDDLLRASAKHWDEARRALLDGRIERFLRAIGEIHIADFAAELAARPVGESADKRLREFLDRSRADEHDEEDQNEAATLPAGWRPRRLRLRRVRIGAGDDAPRAEEKDRTRQAPAIPVAVPAGFASLNRLRVGKTASASLPPWWFWPVYLLCLAPPGAALLANNRVGPGLMGRYNNLLEAWTLTGMLAVLLLLICVGARTAGIARLACLLPVAGGAVAASGLVRVALGSQTAAMANAGAARLFLLALLPLVALMAVVSWTARRWWWWWAWGVCGAAIAATLHFAGIEWRDQ